MILSLLYRSGQKLDIDDTGVLVNPGDKVMYLSEKADPSAQNGAKKTIATVNSAEYYVLLEI